MKKRTNAFRFDFTGHASLYASVNPIGSGPPSGPSEPSQQSTKRPRIGGEEVDPATLYGAQSFQSMNNYPEGLPNVTPTHDPSPPQNIIKAEGHNGSDANYFHPSPDSVLFNNSPISSSSNERITDASDSGYSDTDYQPSPGFNRILESLLETEDTPPLYHPPIPQIDTSQYETPAGQQQQNYYQRPTADSLGAVRPTWEEQYPISQNGTNMPRQQMPHNQPWQQRPSENPTIGMPTRHHPTVTQNGHHVPAARCQPHPLPIMTQEPQYNGQHYHQQPRHLQNQNTQLERQGGRHFPTGSATQNFMDQIHRSGHNGRYPQDGAMITAKPKQDASLLNSVEISSRITTNSSVQEHKQLEDMVSMLGPVASKDKFEISLECQENTVQFDLHKIATEYQVRHYSHRSRSYVREISASATPTGWSSANELSRSVCVSISFQIS